MEEKKKDRGLGYHLRILKFLCKRQNEIYKKNNRNPKLWSIGISKNSWGTLLDEIIEYRGKPMMATSLERSLRELKRYGYIVPESENSTRYVVSPEGFQAVGIEQEEPRVKEEVSLPPRNKGHINIRCRSCNIVDGYLPEETVCRYCGSSLYEMDQV